VAAALFAVLAGKVLVVVLATQLLGQPFWVRLRAGLLLAQVGEFSFVLVQVGAGTGALTGEAEKIFLVVAVLSIASTPALYTAGRWLAARSRPAGVPANVWRLPIEDHAIVVGYGPTGQTVVAALRALDIPVLAVELNADTVRRERLHGVPIAVGDATRATTLQALGITSARMLVLAINDTAAAARIAQQARQLAPSLHVLARGIYIADSPILLRAGADEVVPQELEASIEILVRVLRRFLVPDDEIGRQIRGLRESAGSIGKSARVGLPDASRIAEFAPGIGLSFWRVHPGSGADGRSLAQIALPRRTGCSVVVARRGSANLPAVTPETVLQAGDVIVVIGPEERLPEVAATFVPAAGTAESGVRRATPGPGGQEPVDVSRIPPTR
jgi:CPA2 family monovalent cation:H+ antiporter-2